MADRFKLHGTYRTPRFRLGATVTCEVRGELRIVGVTDARIPWPLGRNGRGRCSLIVNGTLARAVQRESVYALCHWFGVNYQTVTKWRKVLGVPQRNYGTRKLWEANHAAGSHWNGVKAGMAKASDPIRRAKIAAAHRGKPKPSHVVEAVSRAHRGRRRKAETRQRMVDAWKRRGKPKPAGGPWRSWEDDLVRTLPTSEVVRWTGRTITAVRWRRRVLRTTHVRANG
jgi:hypothetical protein